MMYVIAYVQMDGDDCVDGGDTGGDLVDPSLQCIWYRFPCTITADDGGWFLTSLADIYGSEMRKHMPSTSHSVEIDRKTKATWRKAIHWAIMDYCG